VMEGEAVEAVIHSSLNNQFGMRTMIREVVAGEFFLRP